MPTLPDTSSAALRRRARARAADVRRNQEQVWRFWVGAMLCTALPLLASSALPFPRWALWASALLLMALVCGFAAGATNGNRAALSRAVNVIRRQQLDLPWRSPSLRTLELTQTLFVALGGAYGSLAFAVGLHAHFPANPEVLAFAPLPPLLLVAWLRLSEQQPTGLDDLLFWESRGSQSRPREANPSADERRDTSSRASARPTLHSSGIRDASFLRTDPSARGNVAPEADTPLHDEAARRNQRLNALHPALSTPIVAPSSQSGAWHRPKTSTEAEARRPTRTVQSSVESLRSGGAESPPPSELETFLTRELRPAPTPTKQRLAEPRRTPPKPRALDSAVALPADATPTPMVPPGDERSNAVASGVHPVATQASATGTLAQTPERSDTVSPPASNTERPEAPLFRESEVPTTPAPAKARRASGQPMPTSTELPGYDLAIPRSPRTPSIRLDHSGPRESYAPSRTAPQPQATNTPTAHAGAPGGGSEGLALRPTRRARDLDVELEERFEAITSERQRAAARPASPPPPVTSERRRITSTPPPKPRSFTKQALLERGDHAAPPSQFEVAYNSKGGPGYVQPDDGPRAQDVGEAPAPTDSSVPPGAESSVPPRATDSEIRWSREGEGPSASLEQGLLDVLNRTRNLPETEDEVTRSKRKTALH